MSEITKMLNRNFSKSDKESCIPVIQKLIKLAILTRSEGVLALEAEVKEEPDIFLKEGLTLIAESIDPCPVEKFMQNLILSGDYTDGQLLQKIIMAEGVLSIQQGENPHIMARMLLSMLGESYLSYVYEVTK